MIMPQDYLRHPTTNSLQGILCLTDDRNRRIDRAMTPRTLGLEPVDSSTGQPIDPVRLVHQKLTSRAASVNDNRPLRHLRQLFKRYDLAATGSVTTEMFKSVLRHLNVFVNDSVFASFASNFRAPDGGVDYKRFLRAVQGVLREGEGRGGCLMHMSSLCGVSPG